MSEVKDLLSNKVVSPGIANNAVTESVGIVLRANEKENVCDIAYVNSAGKWERKSNIEYEIKNKKDDYFPKINEKIVLKESNDNQPIIKGALIDFVRDARPERTYKKDVQAGRKYQTRNKIVG